MSMPELHDQIRRLIVTRLQADFGGSIMKVSTSAERLLDEIVAVVDREIQSTANAVKSAMLRSADEDDPC